MAFEPGTGAPAPVDVMNARIVVVIVVAAVAIASAVAAAARAAAVTACRKPLRFKKLGELRVGDRQPVHQEARDFDAMGRAFVCGAIVAAHGERAGRHFGHLRRLRECRCAPIQQRQQRGEHPHQIG